MVTIESKGVNIFGSKFNVTALNFEDAEVTAADSKIPCSQLCVQFDANSIGKQNGGRETGNT